jgi:hypothetical protein
MAEQRELSGTLSRNRKRENDKQPEFKGSATIGGVAYWISGWVKECQDGRFFSLAFTPKEQPSTAPAAYSGPGPGHRRGVPDGEVPFMPERR